MHPQMERGETIALPMELIRLDETDIYVRQGFGHAVGFGPKLGRLVVDFTKSRADPAQLGGGPVPATIAATVPPGGTPVRRSPSPTWPMQPSTDGPEDARAAHSMHRTQARLRRARQPNGPPVMEQSFDSAWP